MDIFKKIKYFYEEHREYVSVVILAVLIVVGVYFGKRFKNSEPVFRIDPSTISLKQGVPFQLRAFFDPDGPDGVLAEEDVSDQTDWLADNQDVAYVGNIGPAKGMITTPGKKGDVTITAKYQTYMAQLKSSVENNSPEISCYPIGKDKVKKNEPIDYIVYFSRIGVPDYTYEWTTPEGQKSKLANPYFSFKTTGEKIVKVVVIDKAGTIVSTDCKPLNVIK